MHLIMLSTSMRLRVREILTRLELGQTVSLDERIFLNKLSRVSSLVAEWLNTSLRGEAKIIDEDIS